MSGVRPEDIDFGEPPCELPDEPVPEVAGASPNGSEAMVPHSWAPLDLLALEGDPPPPPTIGGLAYPGARHVFSGEPEALKTWAALVLAVGELRAGRPVVWVDFETGHRAMIARLRDLGLTDEEIRGFLYLAPVEPLAPVLADVAGLLETVQPGLAVFDAFTGALEIHGLDPNSGVEIERFYRTVVKPFQTHGAAVVLLDHLTKDRDKRGKFSIGSERKLGGADVHLGFEVVRPFGRGKSGLAKILTHKDRPGFLPRPKAAELELTSNPETGLITWALTPCEDATEEPFRPTHLMERVSLYVGAHVAEELPSRKRVEENVGGKRDYVRRAIDVLLLEDYLAEVDGPRGARLLRSSKPYREADDAAD